jgi:hypothetical protein
VKTSEQINELAGALAKAQGEMKNAAFDKVNPHFKNKYATLAAIRDAITPTLTKNGISVIQPTVMGEGVLVVTTRLMHSSGQWIESEYPIINDTNKPQAMGSALTYARRYSLAAICGIASDEDDDANAAEANGKGKNGDANRTIDASEFRRLKDLIEKAAADEGKLLAYLKADTLETLTLAQFKTAELALGKKINGAAN